MSDPASMQTLNLKPRNSGPRPATAHSAAGAYGVTQAQAAPGHPVSPPAQAGMPPEPKPRGFFAANWPLMLAATALLGGGIAMGMAVGSSAPPPVAATAVVAPLEQQNSEAPNQQSAGLTNADIWRPNPALADRPALAPPPPPGDPIPAERVPQEATPSASRAEAPPPAAPQPEQPVEPTPPAQLAAAPVGPPALVRAPEGMQAWRARAVAPPADAKPPYVAIIIDDAGLDKRNTARVIALDAPVTLSFMAYAADLAEQSAAARAAGHEVMLHLPMEPLDVQHNNPGPNALYLGLDDAELKRRLAWNLDRFDSYIGINNHMGSRFTTDTARMTMVMEEVAKRQVFWLDSLSGPRSVGTRVARKAGVDAAERDLFLDDSRSPGVDFELAAMERIARARGDVIAIGHPHTRTLDALEKWIAGAREKGFSLVPVSTVLLRRQQQER